jgi:hypothetical protein
VQNSQAQCNPSPPRLWVVLALLAGYLLFCHGCHGDEDNELFARAGHEVAGLASQSGR